MSIPNIFEWMLMSLVLSKDGESILRLISVLCFLAFEQIDLKQKEYEYLIFEIEASIILKRDDV